VEQVVNLDICGGASKNRTYDLSRDWGWTAAHVLHRRCPDSDRPMKMRWMARSGPGSIIAMILLAISGAPVVAQADAVAASSSLIPAAHLRGAVCVVSETSAIPSHLSTPPPTLSPDPSGVTVVWIPGLNSKTCKAVLTRGNAHVASVIASGLDHAMIVQRGVQSGPIMSCPNNDGTTARLYFTYVHRPTQRIDFDLSGCTWITGPGRRFFTAQFRADMSMLAPNEWRAYVAPNPDTFG
jgi:hypothetical protein